MKAKEKAEAGENLKVEKAKLVKMLKTLLMQLENFK